tara:strand:- start:902 stop:2635 length:1734 start_codon:yes stop_codon:yes gene_type:complete
MTDNNITKPSIYQCCLDKSFSENSSCSGKFVLNTNNSSSEMKQDKYEYTNCNNIFNSKKLSGEDDNYGWDNHISDYNKLYKPLLADTYSPEPEQEQEQEQEPEPELILVTTPDLYITNFLGVDSHTDNNSYYPYHSTNEQASLTINDKRNINNKTDQFNQLYGTYSSQIFNGSLINQFSGILSGEMNFCDQEPYTYRNPILCNTQTDLLLNLTNSSESIANGSDICEYKYDDSTKKLTNTRESTSEQCENKYFEYSIDTPYHLGIDSDVNLPYYPSFTKHVKCRWDDTNNKCTMSKGSELSASLVNECLPDNNCTEENFMNGSCISHEFIDHYLVNKGYNKEYSNICSCKYDYNNYIFGIDDEHTINSVLYSKMCKNLGFEYNHKSGLDYINCINAAEIAFENEKNLVETDTAESCMSYNYPCKDAVVSDKCREGNQIRKNFIQICTNVINSNSPSNVNSEQNVSCTQAINDSCGDLCITSPVESNDKQAKDTDSTSIEPHAQDSDSLANPTTTNSSFVDSIISSTSLSIPSTSLSILNIVGIIICSIIAIYCIILLIKKLFFSKKQNYSNVEAPQS